MSPSSAPSGADMPPEPGASAMDARTATAAPRAPAADRPTEPFTAPAPARMASRTRLFLILGAVVVIGAILWGLDWLLVGSHHVTTDDAQVDADVADISPQVSG